MWVPDRFPGPRPTSLQWLYAPAPSCLHSALIACVPAVCLQWLQPTKFDGAAALYSKFLEPFLVQQAPFVDQQAATAMKRVKNMNQEDIQKAIDWLSTTGQAITSSVMGGPPPKPPSASKTHEAEAEKPGSPEPDDDAGSEEVVSVDDVVDAADKKEN